MQMKKWILYWLLSVMILPIVALVNYMVDPYQQYRKATYYPIAFKKSRELNAGLAKNFNYDSVVLGSSMMENFSIKDLKEILHYRKPIKFTMPGSSVYEQSIMLRTALNHQSIKNVLIGMDFFSYYGSINNLKYGESFFPFYLYDENIFNDYKYLCSINTLISSKEVLSVSFDKAIIDPLYSYDKMYEWHSKNNNDLVLKKIEKKWLNREKFDAQLSSEEKTLTHLVNNFESNLKPLIKEYPETSFKLVFPPYSILAFKVYQNRKQLEDFLAFKIYVTNSLKKFKNVEVYDFQVINATSTDFNNYYDLLHYKKYLTTWILKQIEQENYNVRDYNQVDKYKIFQEDIRSYKVQVSSFK